MDCPVRAGLLLAQALANQRARGLVDRPQKTLNVINNDLFCHGLPPPG